MNSTLWAIQANKCRGRDPKLTVRYCGGDCWNETTFDQFPTMSDQYY